MEIFVLIGSFTVVCLLGMPVAYALGIASIVAALYIGLPLEAVMLKVAGGMSGFSLLAIPFFVLAGAIMAIGGMAERLVNLAKVFVGALRGGMALVNILASTMFGCISGSSVADTAAVGSVMIPQMIKNGYPRLFAVNVTISGSLQPLLVPPSHNMVIYSIAAGGTISIAHLFMGGIIPALMLGLSLIILVLIIAHRNNFPKGEVVPLRQVAKIALDAVWGMITVVIIIGGILSGVFTPTESGAIACVYAFFVTMFVYRDVPWSEVVKTAFDVRERLETLGLNAFVKLTGGKGLHVVVPVHPKASWPAVKKFTRTFVNEMVREEPRRFVASMSKVKRTGKIFIDYLRNDAEATAIGAYSPRARPGAPVALPIEWDELDADAPEAPRFGLLEVPKLIAKRKRDPWQGFEEARRSLVD